MNISLDGYFEGPGYDLSWIKGDFEAFSAGENQEVEALLLGHNIYEMMESFWPAPQAQEVAPEIARFMNERQKIVASRDLISLPHLGGQGFYKTGFVRPSGGGRGGGSCSLFL